MPTSIRVATWLYIAALVISLVSNGYLGPRNPADSIQLFLTAKAFFLLLAVPMLIFQGFLLYKIRKARNWARYALLTFVAYMIWREVPTYQLVLKLFVWPGSLSGLSLLLITPVLELAALALLFSGTAGLWLNSRPPPPAHAGAGQIRT